eukprot:137112-Chlamydomonas_euryale.AAC.1
MCRPSSCAGRMGDWGGEGRGGEQVRDVARGLLRRSACTGMLLRAADARQPRVALFGRPNILPPSSSCECLSSLCPADPVAPPVSPAHAALSPIELLPVLPP